MSSNLYSNGQDGTTLTFKDNIISIDINKLKHYGNTTNTIKTTKGKK